jgi:hypothetical protein
LKAEMAGSPDQRNAVLTERRVARDQRRPFALAVAIVPLVAGPADAATKHRSHKAKHSVTKTVTPKRVAAKRVVAKPAAAPATPAPVATPAPAAAPTMTSVISIGGYVFYNLTYAQAVEAYQAAVAAAPAGSTPPPVTSVSVTTTVGGGTG